MTERDAVVLLSSHSAIGSAVVDRLIRERRPVVVGGEGWGGGDVSGAWPDGGVVQVDGAPLDPETCGQAFSTGKGRFGSVGGLITIFPQEPTQPLLEVDDVDVHARVRVQLGGLRHACRTLVSHLGDVDGGRIVTLTSAAWRGRGDESVQSAISAALLGFTRSLALEVGRFGATVNALSVSEIGMQRDDESTEGHAPEATRLTALRRRGRPSEVAGVVAFLMGADAAFMTGQMLTVCGGSTIGKATY